MVPRRLLLLSIAQRNSCSATERQSDDRRSGWHDVSGVIKGVDWPSQRDEIDRRFAAEETYDKVAAAIAVVLGR